MRDFAKFVRRLTIVFAEETKTRIDHAHDPALIAKIASAMREWRHAEDSMIRSGAPGVDILIRSPVRVAEKHLEPDQCPTPSLNEHPPR